MKVTIAQVAKMAGVAKSTVSRYLNGGYVSDGTREKIDAVVKKTGYKPNTFAQSLKAKKTNLIGVIVPRLNSHTISLMLSGIDAQLRELGYQLLISNTNQNVANEVESLYSFANQRVAGIILIGTIITKEHIEALDEIDTPILLAAQAHPRFTSITFDDEKAGQMMGEFVLESGHQNIIYMGVTEEDTAVGVHRKDGFLNGVANKNVSVFKTSFLMKDAQIDFADLFNQGKVEQKTLVVGATDNIALGALKALERFGKQVPKDISVAGFGNYEIADLIGLTTVAYPYGEMGKQAAQKVAGLEKDDEVTHTQLTDFKVIKRRSLQALDK